MQKTLHLLGSCTENFPLIQISSILSVNFTSLWHKCQRVFWWASCTSARHAGSFDCLITSLILITIDNGRGHCAYWQSCKVPNQNHRGIKKLEIYAIKQIKISAEYQDMLHMPRLDLSGTPWLRPIGLSPGSWQTSLGLGSMSRYLAQILIYITIFTLAISTVPADGMYWTHWVWDKIDTISQWHSQMHFLQWKCRNFAYDSLKFVYRVRFDNIPALDQIMAWRRPGDKPLRRTNGGEFADVCMRHSASRS